LKGVNSTVLQVKSERKVKLEDFAIVTGKNITPMASVRLRINGEEKVETALGVGPVDAAINAIRKAVMASVEAFIEGLSMLI